MNVVPLPPVPGTQLLKPWSDACLPYVNETAGDRTLGRCRSGAGHQKSGTFSPTNFPSGQGCHPRNGASVKLLHDGVRRAANAGKAAHAVSPTPIPSAVPDLHPLQRRQ